MCTHAIAVLVTGFVLAAGGLFAGPAHAQSDFARPAVQDLASKPIGKVVVATGSVTLERASAVVVQASTAGQAGQAKVGDLVYQGDAVATGADGRVGINFTDGTSFNLSNNARMVLDEFVYDPNSTSNSTLFNLTKGTFTFVAGKVAKTGDMKIDTPVATMGVRGTTPRVEISDDGTVRFSTLIEEGKSKVARKPGAARGAATRPKAFSQVESEHLSGVLGPLRAQAVLGASNLSVNQVRACRVQINGRPFAGSNIGKPDMEFECERAHHPRRGACSCLAAARVTGCRAEPQEERLSREH